MSNLLVLKSSLNGGDSLSSTLADEYADGWRRSHAAGRVVVRDLASEPVPHLTAERFAALTGSPDVLDSGQRAVVDYADTLVAELRAADEIVLALPMYNFGVPSTLKAYFDHVARAGVTFRYTENGPEGLLGGRRVVVLATRGGQYRGTAMDTQTGYVTNFLAFLGMTDIEFIYAEGVAMGGDARNAALDAARRRIGEIFPLAA